MTQLSVCMVLRDEESVLQRCIDSLGQIFDELCVVDTGSIDRTIDIAKENGARVERFTECNNAQGQITDFAMARNRALELATGDWVLQIDGDEVLQTGAPRVVKHIHDPSIDQVGVLMSSEGAEWVSTRLFRRSDSLRYESRVHEYLVHSGNFVVDRNISIVNFPNKIGKEKSSDRNIRLCLSMLADDPKNSRILHYLGNEYRKLRRFSEAIDAYAAALQFDQYRVGKYHTSYYLAVCELLEGNWEAAIDAAMGCLKIDPRYAEAPCLLGDVYSSSGDLAFAVEWYQSALSKTPPVDAVMAVQHWAYREHPRARLEKILAYV